MRLKYMFETMELGDKMVAIPVGDGLDEYHGAIKLNETASYIFEQLKEDTTEDAIVEALLSCYDVSYDEALKDVRQYLDLFREKGMLVE